LVQVIYSMEIFCNKEKLSQAIDGRMNDKKIELE
jgi:hypothetical protein